MRLILILFFCNFYYISTAQWYDPEKVNSKAAALYTTALGSIQNNNYDKARSLIYEALKVDPRMVDGYLSLAGLAASSKNYIESIKQYQQGFLLDSIYSRNYLLPYSISLAGAGKFTDALDKVNQFLTITNLNDRSRKAGEFRKNCYLFAIDYDKKHPVKNYTFAPKNIGESINTKDLEYFPSITIDGSKMVFTRRVNGTEAFYESYLQNNTWSTAKRLEGNINMESFNEGAQNISQDGQWLIFTGCNFPQGMGSCDLYISYLTKQGWSEPQNLGPNINSEYWETSPSLSPDKKDLYFSSTVPGGFGGSDLWVSHRASNGKWGEAQNLGAVINTAGNESCPFIHADNQTLYFTSDGHPGYSEKPDLYVSRKGADGKWTAPVNLGYPINTIDEEGSLIVSADGKTAYYASDRGDTKGGLDIYTFDLREDVRPLRTLWVKGTVYDKKTRNGLPSTVELTDVNTKQKVSSLQTDENGNYLVTLPVGKNYAFNVARKGYLFYSQNFDLTSQTPDSTFRVDIPLQPIEANANIILNNVFFDSKKTELKPSSVTELDNVVRLMNENPNLKILITGHTDNVGKPADNLILSKGRAKAVVNYLLYKGVRPDRLSSQGYGESKPVTDNMSEQDRALNRRTELTVISN